MVMEVVTSSSLIPSNKCFHIFNAVNGHTYFSNFTFCQRMITVVTDLCGKIKCNT